MRLLRYHTVMNDICIFTPTYNRAYRLPNLFESLKRQDCSNYCWLIVDDGSTDDTEALVMSFKETSPFPISYIKQKNGGKARAHNTGVQSCTSELFFCVDSDDELCSDALCTIWEHWLEVRKNTDIAGLIGLYGKTSSEPLGTWMPKGIALTTMWDLYYKHGFKGDSAHIYRTSILKDYPFKVADDEKFIAETYVYHQIDQHYTLAAIDTILVMAEYLSDGYSKNFPQMTRENPVGYHTLKRLYIEYADGISFKYYSTILYMVGHMLAKTTSEGVKDAPNKTLAYLACAPAWLLCKTVFRFRDKSGRAHS